MIKSVILIAFLCALGSNLLLASPTDTTITDEIKPFIPDGFQIIEYQKGDINNDKKIDIVLILRKTAEDSDAIPDTDMPRPLLLLVRGADNKLTLAAKNDAVVLCKQCGGVFGDPYSDMSVKKGMFTIGHYGGSSWRWTRNLTFKYSAADKTWLLVRDESSSYHTSNPNKAKTTVKTPKQFGKITFENFDVNKE